MSLWAVVSSHRAKAQLDGVLVTSVDGGVLAVVVAVGQLAPSVVGGVAHVEVACLLVGQSLERPVPAAGGLAARAAQVHVPASLVGFP